jgi:hypothetical protein
MGYITSSQINVQRHNVLFHSPGQFTVHLYSWPDLVFLAWVHFTATFHTVTIWSISCKYRFGRYFWGMRIVVGIT